MRIHSTWKIKYIVGFEVLLLLASSHMAYAYRDWMPPSHVDNPDDVRAWFDQDSRRPPVFYKIYDSAKNNVAIYVYDLGSGMCINMVFIYVQRDSKSPWEREMVVNPFKINDTMNVRVVHLKSDDTFKLYNNDKLLLSFCVTDIR